MVVTTPTPPRRDDIIGRKAGTYLIDCLIGEGGMGAVYGGTCMLAGGKRAAIKVMLAEYTANHDAAERFCREAVTAAAVSDMNILDIYGADRFAEDGRLFIVMPFVEGGSLEDLCRRVGPLSVDKLIPIILQVCSGLDAVHAVGVIHRDVKTQNILVTRKFGREHHVYIVDFGIAKLLATYLAGDRNRLTRTRAMLGTPGCMAPEQARGEPDVDARADVYSVGMVMYRALLGRLPYEAPTAYAMLEKQAKREPFPRPREVRPDLPRGVDELILACLEHDRRKRPDSMYALAQFMSKVSPAAERQFEVLASSLATRRGAKPEAATMSGGIETAIARSVFETQGVSRQGRVVRIAAPLALGAVLGAGGLALVRGSGTTSARPQEPAIVTVQSPPSVDAAPPSVAIETDSRADAGVTLTPDAALVTASAPTDAGATAVALAPQDARTKPRRPERERSSLPSMQALATGTGTLVVKSPGKFIEVYVNGTHIGTTPIRKTLDAGPLQVRLVSGDKEETVSVKILPGREATIQRNW